MGEEEKSQGVVRAIIEQPKSKYPHLLNVNGSDVLVPNIAGDDGFVFPLPKGPGDAVVCLEDLGFSPEDINRSRPLARAITRKMLKVLTKEETEDILSGAITVEELGGSLVAKSPVQTLAPEAPHDMPLNHFDHQLIEMDDKEEDQNKKAAERARAGRRGSPSPSA